MARPRQKKAQAQPGLVSRHGLFTRPGPWAMDFAGLGPKARPRALPLCVCVCWGGGGSISGGRRVVSGISLTWTTTLAHQLSSVPTAWTLSRNWQNSAVWPCVLHAHAVAVGLVRMREGSFQENYSDKEHRKIYFF